MTGACPANPALPACGRQVGGINGLEGIDRPE